MAEKGQGSARAIFAAARRSRVIPGWRVKARLIIAAGAILFLSGCLHRRRAAMRPPPPPAAPGAPVSQRELRGRASWYGYPYQGRPTADGEIYNMYAMTAAHRTLPFGTRVRVDDLDNGHSVVVRINDRGPFIEGRIIDLSYAAAESLGMVGPGTARVRLEILNPEIETGPQAVPGIYAVQVGAFSGEDNALRLKALIEPHFGPVTIQNYDSPKDGLLYRVRVGQLNNEQSARTLASNLKQAGLTSVTYVVRLN
ncbi:MAG: septal ring lytic transglycosylase RlpA family protein [Acidobacteriota bacterium]|nr:septal ring lytic transglycosylase RlpA family protein [Acidobacteriota bacterium]